MVLIGALLTDHAPVLLCVQVCHTGVGFLKNPVQFGDVPGLAIGNQGVIYLSTPDNKDILWSEGPEMPKQVRNRVTHYKTIIGYPFICG